MIYLKSQSCLAKSLIMPIIPSLVKFSSKACAFFFYFPKRKSTQNCQYTELLLRWRGGGGAGDSQAALRRLSNHNCILGHVGRMLGPGNVVLFRHYGERYQMSHHSSRWVSRFLPDETCVDSVMTCVCPLLAYSFD